MKEGRLDWLPKDLIRSSVHISTKTVAKPSSVRIVTAVAAQYDMKIH